MRIARLQVAAAAVVLISVAAHAEETTQTPKARPPQPGQPAPGGDVIGSKLFPPELIMSHQQELGVDEPQRAAILKEIEKTQSQVLPLQWQMQAAMEQLTKALDAPKIDEGKTLATVDRLMDLERQVKRTHLGMLIRIRNLLTDAQRAKLTELRAKSSP
ncbi:MAG TPA: periplasmic heavy metal sensor [Myxococcaceae bacterium]|nr:periplasmic heavy metal sensor [Myxococcaceae bacterium]